MTTGSPTVASRVVAIVDPCCAKGYAPATIAIGGLGGTEATILRVCGALAHRAEIVHFQKGRHVSEKTEAGTMMPLDAAFRPSAITTFIVINAWKVAAKLRKVHPQSRILLWLHIHPGKHNRRMGSVLKAAKVDVVCVSRSHAEKLGRFLDDGESLNIDYVYNPVVDGLRPDDTPRNPDRLLFASSPHKGLAEVFAQFRAARKAIPALTLEVADPGYLAWNTGPVPEGVMFLGPLPHADLINRMRRAFCLFYPQTTFAETFGIVLAEANAVGTPVLVHRDLGANAEVVGDPAQLVDGRDEAAIIDRLRVWRIGAPAVGANPAFKLRAVTCRWADILGLPAVGTATADRAA